MIANLIDIQNELKAPKSNFNSFGKYKYRSAEDILTAVKPLLHKYGCQMTIKDDVIAVNDRIYIKATVTLTDADGNTETTTAFAREDETKKGMDGSQVTGAASSYARKYALNGLFLIDDTKDADTDEYHQMDAESAPQPPKPETANKLITKSQQHQLLKACENAGPNLSLERALEACGKASIDQITQVQFSCLMKRLQAVA